MPLTEIEAPQVGADAATRPERNGEAPTREVRHEYSRSLPPLLSAALLFLTPMSFLISTTRNCRLLSDWLALGFGLMLGPVLALWQVGLDLLWTGIVGGSVAYAIYRLREARR